MAEHDGRSFIKPEYYESEMRRVALLKSIDNLIQAQAQAMAETDR